VPTGFREISACVGRAASMAPLGALDRGCLILQDARLQMREISSL
jgi:hypothetical protein